MNDSTYRKLAMLAAVLLVISIVSGAVALLLSSNDHPPIQVMLPSSEDSATSISPSDPEIKVYISGAVNHPGVYQLEPGDRLVDVLEQAGGAAQGAQLDAMNLSLRVADQDHYHIPRLGEVPSGATSGLTTSGTRRVLPGNGYVGESAVIRTTSPDGRIDLNSAPAELLETLPGIGPVLAKAIIDYRESNGGFQTVEEVTNVPRIGPITYQKMRDLVTVTPIR